MLSPFAVNAIEEPTRRYAFRYLAVVGRLAVRELIVAAEADRLALRLHDRCSRLPYKDLVRLQL